VDTYHPKITVVTVVLNDAAGLEKTILSVLSQDYDDLEVIIIDGGSTDGSGDIIRNYAGRIDQWISEPDAGPYDGMNKGIARATGEWICFMNAGDVFYDSHTMAKVFLNNVRDYALIYGDAIADYAKFKVYRKCREIKYLWKGMIFFHQSMFVRTSLIKNKGYDLHYRIGADYDMIARMSHEGHGFLYLPFAVAVCDAHGLSNRLMHLSAAEHEKIIMKYEELKLSQRLYYGYLKLLLSVVQMMYGILPRDFLYRIIKWVNKNKIHRNDCVTF
jgi:glycosyltransferase involved in cell wall biosynthesis